MTSLRPLYSLPCQLTNRITLIARTSNGSLEKYELFDSTFSPKTCNCCPIIDGIDDFSDSGAQGIRYRRSHRDDKGNQLICLAIDWNNGQGLLETFVAPDGRVSRYQWNAEKNAFEILERFGIQMIPSDKLSADDEILITDDQIMPLSTHSCSNHGILLSADNGKYSWNPFREQFERITCDCRNLAALSLTVLSDTSVLMMRVDSDKKRIQIIRNNGRLEKLHVIRRGYAEVPVVIKPSIVRDLRGKSVTDFKKIRLIDEVLYTTSFHSPQETSQLWFLFKEGNVKDLMVNESGNIVSSEYPTSSENKKKKKKPMSAEEYLKSAEWQEIKRRMIEKFEREELTPEERESIGNALLESDKAIDKDLILDLVKFQELMRFPMKVEKRQEINWDDYDLPSDTETIKEDSDSESDESDVDYDSEDETQKPMAPESVITRDDDSYSVVSDVF